MGSEWMPRCKAPDCKARTLKGDFCSRHRPPDKKKTYTPTPEAKARRAASARRQRMLRGLPNGYETV